MEVALSTLAREELNGARGWWSCGVHVSTQSVPCSSCGWGVNRVDCVETLMCDKGEMALPSSNGVVVSAVMLLLAVTVVEGRSFCSITHDQDGSDTALWSSATPVSLPCSRAVGGSVGSVEVSTAGGLGCSSVLDAVLEGSRAGVVWIGPYTQDCFVLVQPPHTGFFSSHFT